MSEDLYLKDSLARILISQLGNITESNIEGASTFTEAVANIKNRLPFRGVLEVSSNLALNDDHNGLVLRCDCASNSGNIILTLPLMALVDPWFIIVLKATGTSLQNVLVQTQSGNTIDKVTSITIGRIGQSALILSGGKNGTIVKDFVSLPFSKPVEGTVSGSDIADHDIDFIKLPKIPKASVLVNIDGGSSDPSTNTITSVQIPNGALFGRYTNEDLSGILLRTGEFVLGKNEDDIPELRLDTVPYNKFPTVSKACLIGNPLGESGDPSYADPQEIPVSNNSLVGRPSGKDIGSIFLKTGELQLEEDTTVSPSIYRLSIVALSRNKITTSNVESGVDANGAFITPKILIARASSVQELNVDNSTLELSSTEGLRIKPNGVQLNRLIQIPPKRLLGNALSATGTVSAISIGTGLELDSATNTLQIQPSYQPENIAVNSVSPVSFQKGPGGSVYVSAGTFTDTNQSYAQLQLGNGAVLGRISGGSASSIYMNNSEISIINDGSSVPRITLVDYGLDPSRFKKATEGTILVAKSTTAGETNVPFTTHQMGSNTIFGKRAGQPAGNIYVDGSLQFKDDSGVNRIGVVFGGIVTPNNDTTNKLVVSRNSGLFEYNVNQDQLVLNPITGLGIKYNANHFEINSTNGLQVKSGGLPLSSLPDIDAYSFIGNPTGSPTDATNIRYNSTHFEVDGTFGFRIKPNGLSLPLLPEISARKLLGNSSTGSGNVTEISVGTGLALNTLSSTPTLYLEQTYVQAPYGVPGGRLTVVDDNADPDAGSANLYGGSASSGTLYYEPYHSNRIILSTQPGSLADFVVLDFTTGLSIDMSSQTIDTNYDVWAEYYTSSGNHAVRLAVTAWGSNTSRYVAPDSSTPYSPTRSPGFPVMRSDYRFRYLGTVRVTTGGIVKDTAIDRHVWNYYNQIPKQLFYANPTSNWIYTTTGWRQRGASSNVLSFVQGFGSYIDADLQVQAFSTGSGILGRIGIGIDSNIPMVNSSFINPTLTTGTAYGQMQTCRFRGKMRSGYHDVRWLELGGTGVEFVGTTLTTDVGATSGNFQNYLGLNTQIMM